MKVYKFLYFVFCMVSASALTAQNLIPHQYSIGSTGNNGVGELMIDEEGNYYVFVSVSMYSSAHNTGNLGTFQYGTNFFVVSKHKPDHELIWRHAYGGDSTDLILGVVMLNDGFIVSTQSNSPPSGTKTIESFDKHHLWLQKIDFNGSVVWQKGYYTIDNLQFGAISELADGNFLICSNTEAGIGGDKTEEGIGLSDNWLLKVDSNGEKIWDICVGTEDYDSYAYHVGNFSNGDFLIATHSFSGVSGNKTEESYGLDDVWLIRLSSSTGEIIWDKTIGAESSEMLSNGLVLNNEIYLFVNSYSDVSGLRTVPLKGVQDYWYLRLNSSGDIIHQSCFGGTNRELNLAIHSISSNEMFLMLGSNSSVGLDKNEESRGEFDLWLIKSDISGNITQQKTIGGDNGEGPGGMVTLPNGNYLLTASSKSGVSGEKTVPRIGSNSSDAWILEIDAVTLNIVNEHQIINESVLFPNPTTNQINISFTEPTKLNKAVLYDLSGKMVREQSFAQSFDPMYVFSTAGLASGVYSLSLVGDGFVKTQQVVVE